MSQRVQAQAAKLFGGIIPIAISGVSMGKFMKG
jgi:hypothetical protein